MLRKILAGADIACKDAVQQQRIAPHNDHGIVGPGLRVQVVVHQIEEAGDGGHVGKVDLLQVRLAEVDEGIVAKAVGKFETVIAATAIEEIVAAIAVQRVVADAGR